MAQTSTFGRRGGAGPSANLARGIGRDAGLSPEAEAFRASLRSADTTQNPDFADWSRTQRPRRAAIFVARIALLMPGVICFAFHAPWYVSIGVQLAGVAANALLRTERRRYLQDVADWKPSD